MSQALITKRRSWPMVVSTSGPAIAIG